MHFEPDEAKKALIYHDDKFKNVPTLDNLELDSIDDAIELIDGLSDPLMVTINVYEVFRCWSVEDTTCYKYECLIKKYQKDVKYLYKINVKHVRNDIRRLHGMLGDVYGIEDIINNTNLSKVIQECIKGNLAFISCHISDVPQIEFIIKDVPQIEQLYHNGRLQLNENALKWYSIELLKKIIIKGD